MFVLAVALWGERSEPHGKKCTAIRISHVWAGFRAFDSPRKFRSDITISRVGSPRGKISLTPHPWFVCTILRLLVQCRPRPLVISTLVIHLRSTNEGSITSNHRATGVAAVDACPGEGKSSSGRRRSTRGRQPTVQPWSPCSMGMASTNSASPPAIEAIELSNEFGAAAAVRPPAGRSSALAGHVGGAPSGSCTTFARPRARAASGGSTSTTTAGLTGR